jgi:two-component system phosphate regulon response regulator PhoB
MSATPTDDRPYILIVDDDLDVLEALGTLVEIEGSVGVERASSAFAAHARQQKGTLPSLMLLDIRMPGMIGRDHWSWMQREPATAGVPVVMITGEPHDRAAAVARGVRDVLRKPVDAKQVLALIGDCCAER